MSEVKKNYSVEELDRMNNAELAALGAKHRLTRPYSPW